MARSSEEDKEIRSLVNEIIQTFNRAYGDISTPPDEASVQALQTQLSSVWNRFFSGGRIDPETDLDIMSALARIPFTYWPESISFDVYTTFTHILGRSVASLSPTTRQCENGENLRLHAENKTSQSGEDGILRRIFEIMGTNNQWCVEFGAWDGKKHSNTYALIADNAWHGVLIEGDTPRFRELENTYRGNDRVDLINDFVGFDPGRNSIDTLLGGTSIPADFDLLIVDIDGNDWHVWHSMQAYRPRVVVIEHNPSIPNDVIFIQERNQDVQQGNSLRALVMLGKEKGYELICTTN